MGRHATRKAVFKELGVNPIPLPISDVLMALQTGMVETVYISPSRPSQCSGFTKVSFMTNLPLAYSSWCRGREKN